MGFAKVPMAQDEFNSPLSPEHTPFALELRHRASPTWHPPHSALPHSISFSNILAPTSQLAPGQGFPLPIFKLFKDHSGHHTGGPLLVQWWMVQMKLG